MKFPVDWATGVYWYTSRSGSGAMFNTGRSHTWLRRGQAKDGYTACTQGFKPILTPVKFMGKTFVKVKVSGAVSAASIRKACSSKGLVPVCNYPNYCRTEPTTAWAKPGRSQYFSLPIHDKAMKFPIDWSTGVYWYTSRSGTGAQFNTGKSHIWLRRGQAKDGYTACTQGKAAKKSKKTSSQKQTTSSKKTASQKQSVSSKKKPSKDTTEISDLNKKSQALKERMKAQL